MLLRDLTQPLRITQHLRRRQLLAQLLVPGQDPFDALLEFHGTL